MNDSNYATVSSLLRHLEGLSQDPLFRPLKKHSEMGSIRPRYPDQVYVVTIKRENRFPLQNGEKGRFNSVKEAFLGIMNPPNLAREAARQRRLPNQVISTFRLTVSHYTYIFHF